MCGGSEKHDEDDGNDEEDVFPREFIIKALGLPASSFSTHIISDHLLMLLTDDLGLEFSEAMKFVSALNLTAFVGE